MTENLDVLLLCGWKRTGKDTLARVLLLGDIKLFDKHYIVLKRSNNLPNFRELIPKFTQCLAFAEQLRKDIKVYLNLPESLCTQVTFEFA